MTRPKHEFQPCVPGALRGGLSRTEFYDGMMLGEADMKREQSYWQMKRRLTNRALGSGVVWGLSVQWDEKARAFTLCPGYGLSCCGDDLVVECAATVGERALIDICSADFRELLKAGTGPCEDTCDRPDGPVEARLMLEYVECPEDPRQVFEDPCATLPGGCRHGAMRETTRLRLVPPPCPPEPGPIERFCARIDKLRTTLAGAGKAVPAPVLQPLPFSGLPAVMLEAQLRDGGGNALENRHETIMTAKGQTVDIPLLNPSVRSVEFTLTPPLGYGFLWTRDETGTERRIETLMELAFTESDLAKNGRMDRRFTVELAPLAGGAAYEVDYQIAATAKNGGTDILVTALVADVRGPRRVADCGTLMQGWVFDVSPDCAARTLLLAAIWGWVRGLTGTAPCTDPPDQPDQTRLALAALVAWLSWQILWKIDLTDAKAAEAERCLRQLFEDWCHEFNYRGPRCCDNHHGIILGRVTISRKGRVLCFDAWAHRRYVLTGPLVSHWTGLFGVAPVDVMATRLAGWICCVAGTPDVQIDPAVLKAMQSALMTAEGELKLGGGQVISLKKLLGQGGTMGVAKPLESFPTPAPAAAKGMASVFAEHVRRREESRLDAAPVMARAPAMDMMREVKSGVKIADLRPLGDAGLFDATLASLGRARIVTVDDLLSNDPESLARLVGAEMVEDGVIDESAAAEKAVGTVYAVALKTIQSVGDVVAAVASERSDDEPFTRADIREAAATSAIRKAVNENLRGRGLTVAAVRDIAGRVADRR
jgi:hypothetical protein